MPRNKSSKSLKFDPNTIRTYYNQLNQKSDKNDVYPFTTKEGYNLSFAYYQLLKMKLNDLAVGGGQPLITAGKLKQIIIPVPSLEEQTRIVSILNRFDVLTNDLTSGLPAEIEARRKQYEYYRDKLLAFKELIMN